MSSHTSTPQPSLAGAVAGSHSLPSLSLTWHGYSHPVESRPSTEYQPSSHLAILHAPASQAAVACCKLQGLLHRPQLSTSVSRSKPSSFLPLQLSSSPLQVSSPIGSPSQTSSQPSS